MNRRQKEEGLEAAREWAQWFLGDPSWANQIVYAYEHPVEARATLQADKA